MSKASESKSKCACRPVDEPLKVESIISVDERGQMVLPKEVRVRAGIKPGDKLALVTREKNGKVCCIYLFKSEELATHVKGLVGPLAEELG
jgi:AbrB family looped-hinge helix DNA binding protein